MGHRPARLHDHRFRYCSSKFLLHLVRNSFHTLAFDLDHIGHLGLNDSGDPDPFGSQTEEAGARPHFPGSSIFTDGAINLSLIHI